MKKKILIVLTIFMLLFVTACGKTGEAGATGSSANGVAEQQPGGDAGNEDTISISTTGMSIKMPQTYLDNKDKVLLYYDGGEYKEGLYVFDTFIYPDTYEGIMAMSDADREKVLDQVANPLTLLRVTEAWDKSSLEELLFANVTDQSLALEEIKKEDGHTVFALTNEEISESVSDELKPIYQGIISELLEAKNNVELTDPIPEGQENVGKVLSFTTKDLDGNEVKSEDIFSKNEYTMVNCWASWCGPCVGELPEIEKLSQDFSEKGGGVIGILIDGDTSTGLEDGKDIVSKTGVTYLNVIANPEINEQLMVQAFPTTYFVDSKGTIVGEAVIGAYPDSYEKIMNDLIG